MRVKVDISDIQSSLIKSMEYVWYSEEESIKMKSEGHLRVHFQNDSIYIYEDVPLVIVLNIAAADSVGENFNFFIKNESYRYYKE